MEQQEETSNDAQLWAELPHAVGMEGGCSAGAAEVTALLSITLTALWFPRFGKQLSVPPTPPTSSSAPGW